MDPINQEICTTIDKWIELNQPNSMMKFIFLPVHYEIIFYEKRCISLCCRQNITNGFIYEPMNCIGLFYGDDNIIIKFINNTILQKIEKDKHGILRDMLENTTINDYDKCIIDSDDDF